MATLVLEFKKIGNNDETRHSNFYSNLKSETTIKESDIDNLFESIYITILSNIQKFIGKSLSWTIDSVIDHTVDISKYNPSAGSSYIKLPKEFHHPRKDLISVHNFNGNKCFKWCLVRCLHPASHQPSGIRKMTNYLEMT